MSDFETGVINPLHITYQGRESNFKILNRPFDSTDPGFGDSVSYRRGYDRRLRDATLLAFEGTMPPSCENLRSNITMAAHWADDESEALERSGELMSLAETFKFFVGETVIRFVNCDYGDVLERERPLHLEIGRTTQIIDKRDKVVGVPSVVHALDGLIPEARPEEFRDVQLARFAIWLPVELGKVSIFRGAHSQKLAAKPKEISRIAKAKGSDAIMARSGIVCLEPNEALYRKTKREKVESLLFGDDEANQLVEYLAGHNHRVYDRLQAAIGDDGFLFDSDKPFPDLSFLTALKSDSDPALAVAQDTAGVLSDIDALLNEVS